ncbi:MAG: ParB N-terminal domain-containing protein [Alphaproteobacteria bacterium]|nr:ParB N-terminal domain-containing protein [Alphaproteobacteria bacterium]
MKVEMISIDKLIPYARNPRLTAHAVDKVAASIKEFGFRQPIVANAEMVIIAGHVRHLAAQKLGLKKVPVHIADDLTETKVKAYRIADNRTGEDAQWDNALLALEIGDLDEADFDNTVLGFEPSELEQLHRGVEGLLNDGIESGDEQPIDEADTRATIGPYSFIIDRNDYLPWIETLKQEVGFDKEAINNELRSRLGL